MKSIVSESKKEGICGKITSGKYEGKHIKIVLGAKPRDCELFLEGKKISNKVTHLSIEVDGKKPFVSFELELIDVK